MTDPVRFSGAVVLSGECEHGGAESDGGHEDDLFDAHGDACGCDGLFTEVFGKP